MSKGGFIKDAMILFAITLVAGACLGGVYSVTKDPIDAANLAAKNEAYRAVLPDAADFAEDIDASLLTTANEALAGLSYGNVTVDEAVTAQDASGNEIGHVITATSNDGFGGAVTVSVGILSDGTVNGIEFLTLAETAGLGMNADKPEFKSQYAGKNVTEFSVTKDGATSDDQINALSGATITSRAVTNAVNSAVYFVNNCLAQ
ncbi:MAG: RnfABCDGE type electron transport complex subunit G [Clostridiales bacterium]|nr:RnfABCDGE type electron transport complex subunit G [Clostridiales bacterium]